MERIRVGIFTRLAFCGAVLAFALPALPGQAVVSQTGAVVSGSGREEGTTTTVAFTPSLPSGIAAGDVTARRAVLWARSSLPASLLFEWSTDPDFLVDVRESTAVVADPEIPAKLTIRRLQAATEYAYRVTNLAAAETVTGKFRTPAMPGARPGLNFGTTGDWQQAPPYPVLRNVPDRDLDLFIKLGDTIYGDIETPALPGVLQARTLAQFRTKHAEGSTARAGAPDFNVMADLTRSQALLAIIDDHEIVDNFAGGAAPGESPDAPDVNPGEPPLFTDSVRFVNRTRVYRDALMAFQEYHPLQMLKWFTFFDWRTNGRPKLYRMRRYGNDALFVLLDSRSFRDDQLPPVAVTTDPVVIATYLFQTFLPGRTMLGRTQVRALKADLRRAQTAGVTWKFVIIPEPIQNFGVANAEDRFEGYAAERTEILAFIEFYGIDNVVFLSADFHGTLINNLSYQFFPLAPVRPINAFEIVTGPAAFYDGVFGPVVAALGADLGVISPGDYATYLGLPVAPDPDSVVDDKDDFLKELINSLVTPLGYDPVGLNDNLPAAAGLIDATLLQGDYVCLHQFAWAEFNIAPVTQVLTVTIWGLAPHSEADFLADPGAVTALVPQVVTRFEVVPQ